ncbi:MAG: type IV pilin protein [Halioglobus sp.]|nr:type IV pilin protein [Halioglobus sp.]
MFRFKTSTMLKKSSGFTLVEAMVVLAIVGILMAVTVPMYQESVRKARRSDGMDDLLELASRQERFFAQNSVYTLTIDGPTGLNLGRTTSSEEFYNLSVLPCDAGIETCYVLTAAPAGAQTMDTACGSLTLNRLGQRNATGTLGSDCW